ncbi:LolA family protein [Pseudonocardia nigra]|uniref:LolA family protein n=1 Tax=Pseudonocardia nigra TaxID=1921578 RepID=UPI0027E22601|nr:outer membrane lipoprotein carrier protein LolA [Pseudonocardia nigra]
MAAGVAVAGAVGLGLLAVPAGAGAQPTLPPVTPEELVASVITADPGAFGGEFELDNALGLPAVPGMPQAADGTSTARVWSDGEGRGRVQLPTDSGERTIVADGDTLWLWNSDDSTVTRAPEHHGDHPGGPPDASTADPVAAATAALAALQPTSEISVDGTGEVAGRPAYELVLAPASSERTLLREVRVAVDAERRVPLQLTVLANGSSEPVLELGFTDIEFAEQDPSLFTFTPPPGAEVQEPEESTRPGHDMRHEGDGAAPTIVGEGWDTVVVADMGDRPAEEPADADAEHGRFGGEEMDLSALGTPVSGPWGSGTLITTAVASAIITDDGRIAAGAVPEQVLTEALSS